MFARQEKQKNPHTAETVETKLKWELNNSLIVVTKEGTETLLPSPQKTHTRNGNCFGIRSSKLDFYCYIASFHFHSKIV